MAGQRARTRNKRNAADDAAPEVARRSDAIALLRADHRRVQEMFKEFGRAPSERSRGELAKEICEELRVHMQIEEELFTPLRARC